MPINIPAHDVNSGFSIGLGGEHLKYDRFKMYIDQGVHFQIIISKSFYDAFSLSLLFAKSSILKCGRPTLYVLYLFYCMGVYVLSFDSSFECFYVLILGKRSVSSPTAGKPEGSSK